MGTQPQDSTGNVEDDISKPPSNPKDGNGMTSQVNTSSIHADDRREEASEVFDAHATINPAIERAVNAFRRDLPELLKNKRNDRKWVAYNSKGVRIGIHSSDLKLYEKCIRQGYQKSELVIRCIFPEAPDIELDELIHI